MVGSPGISTFPLASGVRSSFRYFGRLGVGFGSAGRVVAVLVGSVTGASEVTGGVVTAVADSTAGAFTRDAGDTGAGTELEVSATC
jgi:hypothetical protein